jgi:exodeoxyribonuclease V beta subunit
VTVHKSKGLQYPLVFLPFAVSAKTVTRGETFYEYTDGQGRRVVAVMGGDDAVAAVNAAIFEEDLRLLYVALTRAEHGLWLGATSLSAKTVSKSALNYLIHGDTPAAPEALFDDVCSMTAGQAGIAVEDARREPGRDRLQRESPQAALLAHPAYQGRFERNWIISSYTALSNRLSDVSAPQTPAQDALLQESGDALAVVATPPTGWHALPRGALPGLFMHAQLEWLARDGFAAASAPDFNEQVLARCKAAGWERHGQQVHDWLLHIVGTPLPAVGAALRNLRNVIPEMEFWLPVQQASVGALDLLCQQLLTQKAAPPALAYSQLHGMLHGFQDLVFEHDGRYWVLDYKASWLGQDDAAYTPAALSASVAANRYDVQGALYLLALHRLLRSRLGAAYAPDRQLGGALFFFLRGVGHAGTRGCFHLKPDTAFLDRMDALLRDDDAAREAA